MFEKTFFLDDQDIEPVYWHVHHAHALRFFEKTRVAFLEEIGCSLESFIEQGIYLVISRIKVDYKREIKKGEIRATCEEVTMQTKALVIQQKLYNEKGKLAIEAEVESQFLDKALARSILIPGRFVNCYNTYISTSSTK